MRAGEEALLMLHLPLLSSLPAELFFCVFRVLVCEMGVPDRSSSWVSDILRAEAVLVVCRACAHAHARARAAARGAR